jgi:tetraacyldisaccharide 4'-kinase
MQFMDELQQYLYTLVHSKHRSGLDKILLAFLQFLSYIYGLGVMIKLFLYHVGLLRQFRLPCLVISLGNITVGGTGKTPTAQKLASLIRDMGYRVAILNRGYRADWQGDIGTVSDGRKLYMTVGEAGDEAYLLAKHVPGAAVVIGKSRSQTGEYAFDKLKADVLILDDGYQHWPFYRDLDIVLIDALNRFGNGYLLPRGTLREPLTNLKRAQAFLLTKVDQSSDGACDSIRSILDKYNQHALVMESVHSPQYFLEIQEWYRGTREKSIPLSQINGKTVLAFCAIGNPSSFEQTIKDMGAVVERGIRYPDHHNYTMLEMQHVMDLAVEQEVNALITTEKDAVKIPSEFIYSDRPLPLYVLGIEVKITCGEQEFMNLVQKLTDEKRKFVL